MSYEGITRDEIEDATDAICKSSAFGTELQSLDSATEQTFLLHVMIDAATLAPNVAVAIKAAYHYGIRIGMRIEKARQEGLAKASIQ